MADGAATGRRTAVMTTPDWSELLLELEEFSWQHNVVVRHVKGLLSPPFMA